MKKLATYSVLGLAILGGSIFAVSKVSAQEAALGLSDEVREEHMAERTAERQEIIDSAIEDDVFTDRQVEILEAMEEVRPVGGRGLQGAGRDLSEEEREALREEMRAQREGSMLDEINEVISGDEVTEEELQELRDLREDLGLLGNQNRRGGGVGGQGTGECPNL
jgi:uncharacterized membrane protein